MKRSLSNIAFYLDDDEGCSHVMLRDGASLFLHGSTPAIREFAHRLITLADKRDKESCPHNWLGGYCDLCGAVKEGDNDLNSGERRCVMERSFDGLCRNVPFSEYLALDIWSQSSIKEARKSALHAKAAREIKREPTDAMLLGTALHLAFLEPAIAAAKIVTYEGKVRRGKEWDAFRSLYQDKLVLTVNQTDALAGMMVAMRAAPFVAEMSALITDVEVSVIGEVCGLRCKARADALAGPVILDIKKVASADPWKIQRAIIEYGLDVQAAMYCEMFHRERFIIVAVEEDAPHDVVPYEFSQAMIRNGQRKLEGYCKTIAHAETTGIWPGRSSVPVLLDPPEFEMMEEI